MPRTIGGFFRIVTIFHECELEWDFCDGSHFIRYNRSFPSSISEAYDQFQVDSLLEQQLSPSLHCVAIRSPRNCPNGVEYQTNGRENYASIADEYNWLTSASHSIIQTNDSGYDEVVIEAVETEQADDTTAIKNGGPTNANPNIIESYTISTQSESDSIIG